MSTTPALPHPAPIDRATRHRELRRAVEAAEAGDRAQHLVAEVSDWLETSRLTRERGVPGAAHPLVVARRVDAALERLRAAPTLEELQRSLPSELSWAGHFDRVLFSRIHLATWRPVSWFSARGLEGPAEDRFRELVRGPEMPLSGGSVEAEVVRRRVSALVLDADATAGGVVPIIGVVGSNSYVVAPVVTGDQVVGMLHADVEHARVLTEADRVAVQTFADGVGLAFERMGLLDQLARQTEQIRAALSAAAEQVDRLMGEPIRITTEQVVRAVEPPDGDGGSFARLTEREREVLELMVGGATNSQIADRLTVSETTVKSHVKHIFRKLRATNRAEAIARFVKAQAGGRA